MLELQPEPKLWTKVEPELKINKFGSATLLIKNERLYAAATPTTLVWVICLSWPDCVRQ